MRIPGILKVAGKKILAFLHKSSTKKILGVLFFFGITILILFSRLSPQQVRLKPDEVAGRDIQSNISAVIVDQKQSDELKRQAASKVQKVYQEDKFALNHTRDEINNFYTMVNEILASSEEKPHQLEELIRGTNQRSAQVALLSSTRELVQYLLNARPEDLEQMRQTSVGIADELMDKPVTERGDRQPVFPGHNPD